jgi:hypothetical protein
VIRIGDEANFPATPIALTPEERQALEVLAASRKSEARMRDRARIVLLAAAGLASRAIGREVAAHPARSPNGGPLRA